MYTVYKKFGGEFEEQSI